MMILFQLYSGLLVCGGLLFTVLRDAQYFSGLVLAVIMLFIAANLYRVHSVEEAKGYYRPFWLTRILSTIFRNPAISAYQSAHSLRNLIVTISYCTIMFVFFVFFNDSFSALLLWAGSVVFAALVGWFSSNMCCNLLKKKVGNYAYRRLFSFTAQFDIKL